MTRSVTLDAAPESRRAAELDRLEMLRVRLSARFQRLVRWEFWPSWAVYAPLVPYLAILALKHRNPYACTHANVGTALATVYGESKWEIHNLLPAEWTVPTQLISPGPIEDRLIAIEHAVCSGGWDWPIILKPDVGERGNGVAAIHTLAQARGYLEEQPLSVLAQRRHPGPFEAGVFYIRLPGRPGGSIFSITDKQFASVRGDGQTSLRALIWRHPRYRAQASAFLRQLGARSDHVPAEGEAVTIGTIGNHCRGTLFLDGSHLITPELEAAIDAIAQRTPGFSFGRFDVRYADPAEFAAGRGFQIIELNGLLSESTNMYDPRNGFWKAQRILRAQWKAAYQIGAANIARERSRNRS